MGKPRVPLDPVADLTRRLARASGSPAVRARTCVRGWWDDHGLAEHPAAVGKRIAVALLEQPSVEAKLAGITLLHETLGAQLRATDLPAFGGLFARGHLADARLVDRFCVKVLATLLARAPDRREAARTIVQWRGSETMWQRRAACVAFTQLAAAGDAALPGLADSILVVCATVVWSHERFDQTAVGWLLRELSRAEPVRVVGFFRKHALLMSKECARLAVAKYPVELRVELLAHHKRATSLARD
jgi:hypothetical protein